MLRRSGKPVIKRERQTMNNFEQSELITRANEMASKMLLRRTRRVYNTLNEAARGAFTVSDDLPVPVKTCKFIQDKNMSIVLINDNAVGYSKFNPNDCKTMKLKTQGGVVEEKISKFNIEAGLNKAMHRALEKALESFSG